MDTPTLHPLEALRGAFRSGHTDDDAALVLSAVNAVLGIDCFVLWDVDDRWGFGGDSELVVAVDGDLHAAPEDLIDFLYWGEGDPAALDLTAGDPVDGPDGAVRLAATPSRRGVNLARRLVAGNRTPVPAHQA